MSVRPTSRAASCMRLASAAESPDSNNCDKAWPPLPWQPPGPPEPVAVWFLGLCSGGSCAGVASAPGWTPGRTAPPRAGRGFKRAETKKTVKGLVEQGAVDRGLGQRGAQRALEQGAVAPTHQFDGARRIDLGVEMDFKVAAAQRLEKVFKRGLHGDSPHPCALVAAGWTSARWRWRCLART